MDKLFKENKDVLKNKDAKINALTNELVKLKNIEQQQQIPFGDIGEEAKSLFKNIEGLGYANMIETNFKTTDTLPTFVIQWKRHTPKSLKHRQAKIFSQWIKKRMQLDTVKIINLP